jgi:glycosyltransferase involved in cell wall biosynthesis
MRSSGPEAAGPAASLPAGTGAQAGTARARVIHLIPYDGIGGVETAARSMGRLTRHGIDFAVDYVFPETAAGGTRWGAWEPSAFIAAARRCARPDVDLLIVSLWRAALVGALAKLLRPRLRLVLFIHVDRDVHWLDFAATRLAFRLAEEVWADSAASVEGRFGPLVRKRTQVISFVTRRLEPLSAGVTRPAFAFWGRLTGQKGLDRAIVLFAAVRSRNADAQFVVIGPDGGELSRLQALVGSLGLERAVRFLGAMPLSDIRRHAAEACFYLQTSAFEGMAVSVVEAMQLGLVPVVTPVGEIARYCEDGVNAVMVRSVDETAARLQEILDSAARYQALRSRAIETWRDKPTYAESVLGRCEGLLFGPPDGR